MIDKKPNEQKNPELGYGHILAIFLQHKLLFLGILIAVLAASIVMTLRKAPTYQSSMQLLVEPNYPGGQDPLTKSGESSSERPSQDYATQINLMKSNLFIEKLVKNLKSDYADISADEIRGSFALEKVVEGKDPTKILKATFTGNSPVKTQKALNSLQEIYQNYNQKQQNLRLIEGLRFVNSQLQIARSDLTQTQIKIEGFRKRNNLINPTQQVDFLITNLNSIDQELRTTQTQYSETQARYAALQNQLNISPQNSLVAARLSQSARYQKQLDSIKETEQELAKQRSIVTDNNPIIENLLDQRQKQIELLRKETTQVLGSSAAKLNTSGDKLLSNGQLSPIDLNVVNSLAELRVNLDGLNARQTKLIATKQDLRKQLNRFPILIAEYDRLLPEVELGQAVIKKLLEQRQDLSSRLSRGGFTWQLVEPPLIGQQIGPNHRQDILLGLVVGVFLASGAVFMAEAFRKTEYSLKDAKPKYTLPLLGSLPVITFSDLNKSLEVKHFQNSKFATSSLIQSLDISKFRDAIDSIFKNIQLYNAHAQLKSLAITSAFAGEGKTIFTLGLALSIARSNLRVLVIDADLRYSSLQKHLSLENSQGLITLLADKSLLPSPVQTTIFGLNIDILTSGSDSTSSNFTELMNLNRMEELISMFTSHYDLVLFDTSPVSSMTGTVEISSLCDGTLLILQPDRLGESELSQVIDSFKSTTLLGIVQNEYSGTNPTSTLGEEKNGNQLSREFQSEAIPKTVNYSH
jgi:polysaccharide biosynthesis transport protein